MATPSRGAAFVVAALLADPLVLFHPTVELDERDRRALGRGEAISRTVPMPSRHIAVFAAVPVSVEAERVARWVEDIAAFKRSDAVLEIGRFSSPPRIEDLAALTLDPEDFATLQGCRPGKCGMLFTPAELERLHQPFGRSRQWQADDLVRVLRGILLARAQAYLADGRAGEPAPAFVHRGWPELALALESQPPRQPPGARTFLYWEKVYLDGKPTITITHVTMLADAGVSGCALVTLSRHVFSTRYISDGWSVMALVPPYFTYFYQARIDRLGGFWGGIVRPFVERQIRGRADDALLGLRHRLERGDPPAADQDVSQ